MNKISRRNNTNIIVKKEEDKRERERKKKIDIRDTVVNPLLPYSVQKKHRKENNKVNFSVQSFIGRYLGIYKIHKGNKLRDLRSLDRSFSSSRYENIKFGTVYLKCWK